MLVSTRMICSGMQNAVTASRPVIVVDTKNAMPITRLMASWSPRPWYCATSTLMPLCTPKIISCMT